MQVDKSVDVDKAVEAAHFALFFNHGQCCAAGSRCYVHEDIYDEFVSKSAERAQRRKVGAGGGRLEPPAAFWVLLWLGGAVGSPVLLPMLPACPALCPGMLQCRCIPHCLLRPAPTARGAALSCPLAALFVPAGG